MSKYVSKDNAERVLSEYADAIKDKVDKVEGKGLSTNDFTDTAAGKLNNIEAGAEVNVLEGVQVDGTDLTISNKKVNVVISGKADKVSGATNGNFASLDSNGNLTDSGSKASDFALASSLGTAAAKDYTSSVTSGSTALVESGAVKDAIDTAVASSYHHAGTKTCAELLPALLVAANEGNVYNITNDGTTTSDFIEGEGKPIREGDNVGVAKVSAGVYKFDLLSGLIDTSNFVSKSQTAGLLKNDGTIDTNSYALNNAVIKGVQVDGTDLTKDANGKVNINNKANRPSTSTAGDIATLTADGDLADGGFSFDKDGQTVSGNPLSFTTDSAQVASDCKITLGTIQEGSGDPSPSNVRPISGYDSVELTVPGKNIISQWIDNTIIDWQTGAWSTNNSYKTTQYIRVSAGMQIYVSSGTTGSERWFYDVNKNPYQRSSNDGVKTAPIDGYFAMSVGNDHIGDTIISVGNTEVEYEPYNPATDITLNFPETVYGGTLNVETGELVVDRGIVDLGDLDWYYQSGNARFVTSTQIPDAISTGDETIVPNAICSSYKTIAPNQTGHDGPEYGFSFGTSDTYIRLRDASYSGDVTSFIAGVKGQKLVYELADEYKYTIHLTPAQVNLLKGANTVTTNGTTITLKYRDGELAKLEDLSGIGESINKLGEIVANGRILKVLYTMPEAITINAQSSTNINITDYIPSDYDPLNIVVERYTSDATIFICQLMRNQQNGFNIYIYNMYSQSISIRPRFRIYLIKK